MGLGRQSFTMRLLVGLCALVVLTTMSAGIPAYLVARNQLERQAWLRVDNAEMATQALLLAERDRLTRLAELLAERPTLQQLGRNQEVDRLRAYLDAFRLQIHLDILLFCAPKFQVVVGEAMPGACTETLTSGPQLLQGQPVTLVTRRVVDGDDGAFLGTAVVGILFDQPFLDGLAASTGAEISVLQADGRRLTSSLAPAVSQAAPVPLAPNRDSAAIDGVVYYTSYLPLADGAAQPPLFTEVALPVGDVLRTQRRSLLILGGSTVLVALLGLGMSIWSVRQLVAPLERLTAAAERISQGDLMADIPRIAQPTEVTTLATALQKSQTAMQQALRTSTATSARLTALVQSVVEGVVAADGAGRITFWSQGAETMFGHTADRVIGRPLDDVLTLADDEAGGFSSRLPAAGQQQEIEIQTGDGALITLAVTRAELASVDRAEQEIVLVLRNVTEEEAVRRMRSYFLANISHEFRTPLSTLNASLKLLLDEEERFTVDETRELLKPAYVSLVTLQTLIDNLLESSLVEAGRFLIRARPFDINRAISDAADIAYPLIERRGQTLSLAEPPALPPVHGDPARITQALVNLVVNASKYSPLGQPIDLEVDVQTAQMRISVADRGAGIPQTERRDLFRRFVRLDAAGEEQYGVGLGLYMVKAIVDAHGGTVGIHDREGGGSVFWIELPLHNHEAAA